MILRSNSHHIGLSSAGLSLLEALIALAILALIMGLSASTFRGPSPALRLQKQAAELVGAAATLRQRAIREAATLELETEGLTCEDNGQPLSFFPDGTASGPDLCLNVKDQQLRLQLNALTARLKPVSQ